MKPQTHSTPVPAAETARKPQVIATRKTCDATGTGLSHYVLMDKEAAR